MIKTDKKHIVILSVLLITLALAYWGWQKYRQPQKESPDVNRSAAQRTASDTLQFAADAAQLLFLKIQPVAAFPEPLV